MSGVSAELANNDTIARETEAGMDRVVSDRSDAQGNAGKLVSGGQFIFSY